MEVIQGRGTGPVAPVLAGPFFVNNSINYLVLTYLRKTAGSVVPTPLAQAIDPHQNFTPWPIPR